MTLLLLLACADEPKSAGALPAEDDDAIPLAYGRYAVTVADTWEGDCELSDDATYRPTDQEWALDPRGDVLVVYLDFWSVRSCSLADGAFDCDDGSWSGGRMQVTRRLEGRYEGGDDAFTGAFVVELDCSGTGCDTLKDTYGNRLDFPCRVDAPVTGVRID